MKNWSPALQLHFAQRVTTLADCWRIQPVHREGAQPLGFTSHQRDLVVDGLTYKSVAFTPSDAKSTAELSVDTMELAAFFVASGITQADIDAGVLDSAEVENFEVDYTAGETEGTADGNADDPENGAPAGTTLIDAEVDASPYIGWEIAWLTGDNAGEVSIIQSVDGDTVTLTAALASPVAAGDTYRIRKGRNIKLFGTLGEVKYEAEGTVIYELDSLGRQFNQQIGNKVGPACINEFGDEWCQVDLEPLTVAGTVTDAPSRTHFFDSSREEPSGHFRGGVVTWTSGDNAGYSAEVRSFGDDGEFELLNPMPFEVLDGDAYTARPTCWKRLFEDCRDRYDNVVNFRGMPNLPGRRAMYATPDLK